jgi:GxxExxY protein
MLNDDVDRLAERVIGCAIEVHRTMGPGLLESIYRECLQMELDAQRIPFDIERLIAVDYKGRPLKARLRIDLLVEEKIILELKAVSPGSLQERVGAKMLRGIGKEIRRIGSFE